MYWRPFLTRWLNSHESTMNRIWIVGRWYVAADNAMKKRNYNFNIWGRIRLVRTKCLKWSERNCEKLQERDRDRDREVEKEAFIVSELLATIFVARSVWFQKCSHVNNIEKALFPLIIHSFHSLRRCAPPTPYLSAWADPLFSLPSLNYTDRSVPNEKSERKKNDSKKQDNQKRI